jgi:hypothetical protein
MNINSNIQFTLLAAVTLAFLVYYLITQNKADRENIFQFKFNEPQEDIESITISIKKNHVIGLFLHRDNGDIDEVVSNGDKEQNDCSKE